MVPNHSNPNYEEMRDATGQVYTAASSSYHSGSGTNVINIGNDFELQSVAANPDDAFTVQQAVNLFGFGWFHVKLSLLVGLCWMADSMEMTILSIIGPTMHYVWHISKYQQAFITTAVFLGMILSGSFWSQLSDRYGRKPALTLCGVLLVLYSLLSSVAPNFLWLLILRGLVGFAIGCVPQSVTLYAEFLPTQHKEKCVVLMDCFWALGACFEIALALVVFSNLGWRWLLGLSATPLLVFTIMTPWLPESPRFHALNARCDKAISVLEQIACNNKRHMLIGRLVTDGEIKATGSIRGLLKPRLRLTTLLLWFIWMACSFCYYGLVLMTTELIVLRKNNDNYDCTPSKPVCDIFDTMDFMDLLWITLSEFPGIFCTLEIVKRFGKRRTMVLQFLLYAMCIGLLAVDKSRIYNTIILFLARGVISGLFQAAYICTPEVYPTALRSVGVGGCSMFARVGAMITPFVAQVLLTTSLWQAFSIYITISVCAAIACCLLPNANTTTNA